MYDLCMKSVSFSCDDSKILGPAPLVPTNTALLQAFYGDCDIKNTGDMKLHVYCGVSDLNVIMGTQIISGEKGGGRLHR